MARNTNGLHNFAPMGLSCGKSIIKLICFTTFKTCCNSCSDKSVDCYILTASRSLIFIC